VNFTKSRAQYCVHLYSNQLPDVALQQRHTRAAVSVVDSFYIKHMGMIQTVHRTIIAGKKDKIYIVKRENALVGRFQPVTGHEGP
jgi:hypothetical protein